MRLSDCLNLALCGLLSGALACGTDPDSMSDPALTDDEDTAEGDESADRDAGGKKPGDAGKKPDSRPKDAGKPKPSDDPNTCQKIQLPSNVLAPEILIVQDRSSSMVGLGDPRNAGKDRWHPSVNALKTLTSELTETVAFGLMLFPAPPAPGQLPIPGLGSNICGPGTINVDVATGSAPEIAATLDRSAPDLGATPTASSLEAARFALDQGVCADCRRAPKYVLLVTDGQPTCGVANGTTTTPEDIEATNAAVDALAEVGIKTYVIGYDTASDPAAAEAMDGFAMHGGTEHHLPVEDETTLLAELTRIAGDLVPCEFELDKAIDNPAYVRVEIDGTTYNFGTDWHLVDKTVVLTPEGGACPKLRDAKLHNLKITRECEPLVAL